MTESKHTHDMEAWIVTQIDKVQQVLDAVHTMTPLLAETTQRSLFGEAA